MDIFSIQPFFSAKHKKRYNKAKNVERSVATNAQSGLNAGNIIKKATSIVLVAFFIFRFLLPGNIHGSFFPYHGYFNLSRKGHFGLYLLRYFKT